jgi:hypothetical protein
MLATLHSSDCDWNQQQTAARYRSEQTILSGETLLNGKVRASTNVRANIQSRPFAKWEATIAEAEAAEVSRHRQEEAEVHPSRVVLHAGASLLPWRRISWLDPA